MIIAAAPMELSPSVFEKQLITNSLANGVMIFVGLGALKKRPFLTVTNGMVAYGVALLSMAGGLSLFFKNVDEGFDVSLFWRWKSGKEHARECWVDTNIWEKEYKTKDEERYKGWVAGIHPTYLPLDTIAHWLEDLATKYEDEQVEKPEWLDNGVFVKRITTIFRWYGKDQERADKALVKLFGRSGKVLEVGVNGQLSYINKSEISALLSRSLKSLLGGGSEGGEKANKVEPEGERDKEVGS